MSKKTRKALMLVLSAIALVAISVGATVAYLTSTDTVTNTFTVGNVKITLDEADVDENGNLEYKEDGTTPKERVKANTYKLMPGHTYTKDPTVHVATGSEDCWLFVKVENGISAIEGTTKIATQMAAKGWTLVNGQTNVYAYNTTVSAGANVVVFESFTISGDADVTSKTANYANAEIEITAYAVQKDGFDTAVAAWTAAGLN